MQLPTVKTNMRLAMTTILRLFLVILAIKTSDILISHLELKARVILKGNNKGIKLHTQTGKNSF